MNSHSQSCTVCKRVETAPHACNKENIEEKEIKNEFLEPLKLQIFTKTGLIYSQSHMDAN